MSGAAGNILDAPSSGPPTASGSRVDRAPGDRVRPPAGPLRRAAVALWRRRRSVLAAALVVALLSGLGSLFLPARYQASATHRVAVTGPAGAGDPAAAAGWVTEVAGTTEFRELAAQRSGPDTTAGQVAAQVEVTVSGSGRVTVTATDADPARARALAGATGGALVSAVAERGTAGVAGATATLRAQMAEIEEQIGRPGGAGLAARQRYDTLARAVADAESAPRPYLVPGPAPEPVAVAADPVLVGALAFVAFLVVLAVAIPAVRAARGRLDETDPARWMRERLAIPAVELHPGPGPSMLLGELYREHLRHLPSLTVVQLSRPHACAVGAELAKAAELVGDVRAHHDVDHDRPGNREVEPLVRTHRIAAADEMLVRALRGTGPTVLAVQTATANRAELERTVAGLRAVGAAPVAAVVWCGRIPRDPLYDPTVTEGVPEPAP